MIKKFNAPRLRFPGFTDEWEQRKLGDVGLVKSGVGFPEKEQGGIEGIPFYKVSDMNHFDNQFEMIVANNYVSQNQIIKNRWSPITDSSAIIFAKVGAAVLLDRKRLCTNSFMLDNNMMAYIFYPEQLNKYFCKFLFDTINLGNLIQVGALPSLNAKDISDIKKYIPNLPEQNRIAKLLLSVETLITLYQHKITNLILKKKSLLQKLFPINGNLYPEIRFPGFNDAWEQRKLSDLMEVTSVKRIHQADWTDSGVRFFRARDIVSSMNNEEIDNPVFISKDKYEEYSRVSGKVIEGDLLVTGVGTIGVPYLIKDTTPLYFKDGNIIWFKNNNTLNDSYFYYCFQNSYIQNQIYSASGKGTVGTYTIENGKKTSIRYPSLKEQIKIGNLLDTMTTMITLHQRKLNHLKLQKKALLQQLFV